MSSTSNIPNNPTQYVHNLYEYYPYDIVWSNKTPKTFKMSINLKIERQKMQIRNIKQILNES
jgi:hypothetical protein